MPGVNLRFQNSVSRNCLHLALNTASVMPVKSFNSDQQQTLCTGKCYFSEGTDMSESSSWWQKLPLGFGFGGSAETPKLHWISQTPLKKEFFAIDLDQFRMCLSITSIAGLGTNDLSYCLRVSQCEHSASPICQDHVSAVAIKHRKQYIYQHPSKLRFHTRFDSFNFAAFPLVSRSRLFQATATLCVGRGRGSDGNDDNKRQCDSEIQNKRSKCQLKIKKKINFEIQGKNMTPILFFFWCGGGVNSRHFFLKSTDNRCVELFRKLKFPPLHH